MKSNIEVSYKEIEKREEKGNGREESGMLIVSLIGGKYETENSSVK